jgi:hypothetical protein
MKIYEQEKTLLTEHAVARCMAVLTLPIKIGEEKHGGDLFIENLETIAKNGCKNRKLRQALAKIAQYDHPELLYGSAILVSTVMNKNDDLFLPEETWSAKASAINIPYNDDHIETDIIGHTIAVRPLDSEGKLIEGDEPPEYFDLEIDFVMYQGIFPAIAKEILEKAPLGQKFVSMEAKFKEFDYGLVDTQGNVKIVARDEETSFLTKYLRCYGGEGVYQEYRMARVLRDFVFSGIGNVDKPANPGSEYTKFDSVALASQSEFRKDSNKTALYVTKGKIMEIKTLEDAQKLIAELQSELAKHEGKEVESVKAELDTLKTANKQLTDNLTTEQTKLSAATNEIESLKTAQADLQKKVNELTAERDAKAAELKKIEDEAKAGKRISELKELGVEVDEAKAKQIAALPDEAFASIVDFTKTLKPKSNEAGDAAAKAKELEKAKEDEQAGAAASELSGDEASEGEKVQKTAAKLIAELRKGRNKAKSNKKE